ncbi:hypothetical protein BC828DRAFT_404940 [Blastocladiella britannica]|nr:hypothetical protein BC828DRAFT_404940 [Blastocladiella britannica]
MTTRDLWFLATASPVTVRAATKDPLVITFAAENFVKVDKPAEQGAPDGPGCGATMAGELEVYSLGTPAAMKRAHKEVGDAEPAAGEEDVDGSDEEAAGRVAKHPHLA